MNTDYKKTSRLAYFVTPAGRKATAFFAGATTLGLCLGNFVPHTLGLSYYIDFVRCYQNGSPRPVPEKVQKRLEKAMEILKFEDYERKFVKPFTVYGFDLFEAGATHYRFGAAIGIPVNYSYETPQEISKNEIRFRDQAINWSSESGKLLQEAIVLTEEEQIFGLCRSLLQLQKQRVLLNSIFPSISFMAVYSVGSYLNLRLNLLSRPFSLRLVMYTILGTFGLGSWCFMKDFNQVSYDADIDKKLSAMGPEFVAAGMSFYEKMLKKNIALRALIGDDTYTAKGNENFMLRQKSLPLTARKGFFEEKWKEIKINQNADEIPQ